MTSQKTTVTSRWTNSDIHFQGPHSHLHSTDDKGPLFLFPVPILITSVRYFVPQSSNTLKCTASALQQPHKPVAPVTVVVLPIQKKGSMVWDDLKFFWPFNSALYNRDQEATSCIRKLISEVKLYISREACLSFHIAVWICISRNSAKCQDKTGGVSRLSASQISIFSSLK